MTIIYKVLVFALIVFVFNLLKAAILYKGMIGVSYPQVMKNSILETIAIVAIGTVIFIDI